MKAVKDIGHSILLNYLCLRDKYYLVVSVLAFFSFEDPSRMLSEQELWPFVAAELGPEAMLDQGLPKHRAEVLVRGHGFAPEGRPVPAMPVAFRVGDVVKELNVFGPRYWNQMAGASAAPSAPQPFKQMGLGWENAFGGRDYLKNPLGKGLDPVETAGGQILVPLPNVESPGSLIGSPLDRPEPAGFGPLDILWPQRAKKAGTYDDRWFHQRWPYYPEDMDPTYFNAAPEDQQAKAFFRGDESLAFQNMHPEKSLIESRLPGLRQRCFVNQLDNLDRPQGATSFTEIQTHIDTVWLFPHAERGIVISRGLARTTDDEARDVLHLYLAAEPLVDQPKPIEYFYEDFQKKLDRTVPIDPALAAEAQKSLDEAKEKLKDLPLKIKDNIAQGLGRRPRPVRAPQEIIDNAKALIDKNRKLFEDGAANLAEMKIKFGHLARIDPIPLQKAGAKLDETKARLDQLGKKVAQAQARIADIRNQAGDKVKALSHQIPAQHLASAGIDPEAMAEALNPGPKNLWHQNGMRFVEECRNSLEHSGEIFTALRNLGLRPYHIRRAWLGINPEERRFAKGAWGLQAGSPEESDSAELVIPPGLVIPKFVGADLVRIRIRPGAHLPEAWTGEAWADESQDILVEGSQDLNLVHPAEQGAPVVRVRTELESLLLGQDLAGLCTVAALDIPKTPLEDSDAQALAEAPQFLVALDPASDRLEDCQMGPWLEAFPQAEPMPIPMGRNIFQARRSKVDLRQWVIEFLKPDFTPDLTDEPDLMDEEGPNALVPSVPKFDVPAMVAEVKAAIMGKVQPKLDALEAKKKEALDLARKRMEEIGQDPAELLKPRPRTPGSNPFKDALKTQAKHMAKARESIAGGGMETAEAERNMAELQKDTQAVLEKAADRYDSGMAKLETAKAKAKAGLPDWAKKLMGLAGLDPEDPHPLRPLTREEVMERYQDGRSLAGKVMDQLDLSELDLSGVNFKGAHLEKAILRGSKLDGADLSGALAQEADFSGASLKQARLGKGLFMKALFNRADLRRADLTQAVMNEADLTEADLSDATLKKTLLEKAKLTKAKLHQVDAVQGIFIGTDVSQADLFGADTSRAVFMGANIEEADFANGRHRKTFFWNVSGDRVRFTGSDLHNARIGGESVIHNGDFGNIQAPKICLMDSDLSGADFQNSRMEGGMVTGCNLSEADLSGVTARQTQFNRSDLSGASLKNANLFQGSIRKVKLPGADLRWANLYGADCFKIKLGANRMQGINFKNTLLAIIKDALKPYTRRS